MKADRCFQDCQELLPEQLLQVQDGSTLWNIVVPGHEWSLSVPLPGVSYHSQRQNINKCPHQNHIITSRYWSVPICPLICVYRDKTLSQSPLAKTQRKMTIFQMAQWETMPAESHLTLPLHNWISETRVSGQNTWHRIQSKIYKLCMLKHMVKVGLDIQQHRTP